MSTDDKQPETEEKTTAPVVPATEPSVPEGTSVASKVAPAETTDRRQRGGQSSSGKGGGFRRPRRQGTDRPKAEFDQTTLSIRRVTRVMAGGRRFSFSVVMAIGDRKGRVGVGIGKAADTALAIQKAVHDARRNMATLRLNDQKSLDYGVSAKYCSARIELRPNYGRGVVAGSSLRSILELGGIHDVTGRVLSRSKNRLNNARAVIQALEPFITKRGIEVPKRKEHNEKRERRSSSFSR